MKFLLAVSVFACFHFSYAQQYGWVRVAQVGDQFTSLSTVEFVDSLHGWLYGSRVNYMYTVDGGTNWMPAVSAGFAATSISMIDTLRGWVAGNGLNEGGIGKTTDGGRSWTQQRLRLDRAYHGTATLTLTKNIIAGSTYNFSPDTGKVVQTSDGGTTWVERTLADSILRLEQVQFVDSLRGWIAYNFGSGLLKTSDGGNTFVGYRYPREAPAFCFLDTLVGFMVTFGNTYCYKTSNAGASWTQLGRIYDPMWDDLGAASVSFIDTLNGWAFGHMFYQGSTQAAIYHTTDGGISWTRELIGIARGVTGMMLDHRHGWAVGTEGSVFAYRMVTGVPEKLPSLPTRSTLKQNYPNPFNPSTSIEYEVPTPSLVNITVYDLSGREVRTLVKQQHEPGVYRIQLSAQGLASGVYVYRMNAGEYTESKQMIILK